MEIQLNNLTKHYGNKIALDNINYTFERGITGLIGSNGAGKSTLMKIISTFDVATKGSVKFNNIDLKDNPNYIREKIGYLPQDFGIYPNMSPVEFLEYMARIKNISTKTSKKRIDQLIDIMNLSHVKDKKLGGFSGGMKQRIGIAQALLSDPAVLIIDEPTVGLDPVERITFKNLLSTIQQNRIIIFSTHIISDIESIAPKILFLQEGKKLFDTTPEEILRHVNGRVWKTVVEFDELAQLQQKFLISSSIQRQDGIQVRIVSDTKPTLNAVSDEPTLEDSYLYFTSERSKVNG